jgi:hypothetical protein
MRIHPLFLTLTALLLTSPLVGAQQTFAYGQDVALPTYGTRGADHATVAVNSFGDSFIAFHSMFASGRHMVEGMAVANLNGGQFQTGSTSHFALGNQSLNLLGEDSCIKPDVVSLPDDSFVVSWTRLDRSGVSPARIEMCRIVMRDAAGALLPAPQVIAPQAGVGYVIDGNFNATDSGGMIDLMDLEDGTVAGVYAHQTNRVIDPVSGDTWRDYDLRIVRVDWNLNPSDPNFAAVPVALMSGIPFDNPGNRIPLGGQVLPDVVLDDNSHMVLAYEEFWLDGHGGIAGSNLGRIVVKRFSGFQTAAPMTEINTDFFTRDPARAQRRPNLSTSRFDTRNAVTLAWGHDEIWYRADKIITREITYQGTSSTVRNLYWANSVLWEDTLPTTACGANATRFTIATREFVNQSALIVARSIQQDMLQIPTSIAFPLRPASALWESPNTSGGIDQSLFTTYEGANTRNAADFLIHLVVHQVP